MIPVSLDKWTLHPHKVFESIRCRLKKRLRAASPDKGQALMEYVFVIAFVCLLIAIAFGLASGTLYNAISESNSSIVNQFNRINFETAKY